jgi:fluoroquinolone transport system permease protein
MRPAVILRADLRNVVRDPVLVIVGLVPLLCAMLVRLGFETFARTASPWFDAHAWENAFAAGVLLTATLSGYIVGMLLLDERDEDILAAIAVTPLGKDGFLVYRTLVPVAWSAVVGLVAVEISGVGDVSTGRVAAFALVGALEAPMMALLLVAYAADKVQGLALFKAANLLYALPFGALFVGPPWRWLAAVVPQSWIVAALVLPVSGAGLVALWLGAAVVHMTAILFLLRRFRRRIG